MLGDLRDADVLSREDMAEIDLAPLEADPAAAGDGNRVVVKGVGEVVESPLEAGRARVEFGRDLHG